MRQTRRNVLKLLAGAPFLAGDPALAAREPSLERLIRESRAQAGATLPERMELISRAFMGVRYLGHTLIGGPQRPEVFVVRTDVFDCVTYCETVMAAALSRDMSEFEATLKRIRYEGGEVQWRRRHHYFADWLRLNAENGIGRHVPIERSVTVGKTVDFANYGRRKISMVCVPREALLANAKALSTGDVIAFVSQRANLDFYHTGFIAFDKRSGALLLRHASQSRGRVLEERMETFTAVNGVKYVALLRPVDSTATAERR